MKLYQRRNVNKTLSSTLEIVLRQVRVLIPQSKILQREYKKRELAILFSFWSVFILTIRIANSWAEIKPTAPLLAFDKENSIEFLLNLLHYIYNYHGYAPCLPQSSYPLGDFFVTYHDYDLWLHCDVIILWLLSYLFVTLWLLMWYFPYSTLVII